MNFLLKLFRFSKYGLIQTVITLIEKIGEFQFKAHPFIFYLFPNDESSQIIISSDLFDLDINWNKWMAEGIPFKNKEQIDKLRGQLFNLPKPDQKKESYFEQYSKLDEARQEQFQAQIEKLNQFLTNNDEQEFAFDSSYPNVRRLYYTYLEESHPELIQFKFSNVQIGVRKCSLQEKQFHNAQILQEKEDKIEDQKGASRTFELIFKFCQQNKTPFLMFNSLFELSQVLSYTVQFLPRSFLEFKQLIQTILPTVIDMKYIIYSLYNQRNIDPSSFLQKNINLYSKHQLNVDNDDNTLQINSLTQRTIDISKMWISEQQKIQPHANKLFLDKSNWIISFIPTDQDILLMPENKVILTVIPNDHVKTMSQKRYSVNKTFQELTKFHRKNGIYYSKSENNNMIIVTVDTTKFNDIEGLKKGYQKLKEAQFDDYEALYSVLLNSFEESNKHVQ